MVLHYGGYCYCVCKPLPTVCCSLSGTEIPPLGHTPTGSLAAADYNSEKSLEIVRIGSMNAGDERTRFDTLKFKPEQSEPRRIVRKTPAAAASPSAKRVAKSSPKPRAKPKPKAARHAKSK